MPSKVNEAACGINRIGNLSMLINVMIIVTVAVSIPLSGSSSLSHHIRQTVDNVTIVGVMYNSQRVAPCRYTTCRAHALSSPTDTSRNSDLTSSPDTCRKYTSSAERNLDNRARKGFSHAFSLTTSMPSCRRALARQVMDRREMQAMAATPFKICSRKAVRSSVCFSIFACVIRGVKGICIHAVITSTEKPPVTRLCAADKLAQIYVQDRNHAQNAETNERSNTDLSECTPLYLYWRPNHADKSRCFSADRHEK